MFSRLEWQGILLPYGTIQRSCSQINDWFSIGTLFYLQCRNNGRLPGIKWLIEKCCKQWQGALTVLKFSASVGHLKNYLVLKIHLAVFSSILVSKNSPRVHVHKRGESCSVYISLLVLCWAKRGLQCVPCVLCQESCPPFLTCARFMVCLPGSCLFCSVPRFDHILACWTTRLWL